MFFFHNHDNPLSADLNHLNSHPPEIVSRYRDPQLQVGENYLYLFNLIPNICKSWCLNAHFVPNSCDFDSQMKQIKTEYARAQRSIVKI